jgi:hypothetical protein
MSYLQINGYPIRVRVGQELSYQDIAGHKAYSFNGRYQCSRNALGRRWAITTAVLPGDEAKALMGMLKMRGDAWRWDLPSDVSPNGVHYIADSSDAEVYSDKRRVPQTAEAKATLASAYGADGSRVYDWNGNAYAPFSGCQGSLLVDGGTTNIGDAVTSWAGAGGPTVTTVTDVKWAGSNSRKCAATAAGQGLVSRLFTTALGDYVSGDKLTASVYVKCDDPTMQIRLSMWEKYAGVPGYNELFTQSLTIPADSWQRFMLSGLTDTIGLTSEEVYFSVRTETTASVSFWVDGFQLENNSSLVAPTAYVGISDNPWGSGNGVRPAGLLNFDQWMTGFTDGITVSAWVNVQYITSAASRVIVDNTHGNPKVQLHINSAGQPVITCNSATASGLVASGAALAVGWHHITGVYSAKDLTAYLYVDGALIASDSTWSGPRKGIDAALFSPDFTLCGSGGAGAQNLAMPLGPIQFFPFATPANFVSGLYASGADQLAVPGLMPLAAQGTMLGSSEEAVYCYAENVRFRMVPHKSPITGEFENGGGEVSFELVEATAK